MRLALHFCDDSPEAREEKLRAGKKHIDCKSMNETLDYFEYNIVSLDLISESPTLGSKSKKNLEREFTSMHYSTHVPRNNVNYKSIAFALSEVVLEDSWLVDFIPSLV